MTTVYISFVAEINMPTTQHLIGTCFDQINKGATELYLLFSTPGGVTANGITLYHVLKGLPVPLTIHNTGAVDSIGNAIFLAGKSRYACANSTFMFHGVGFNTSAHQRFEEKALREGLDAILADQKRIGAIIAQETSLKSEEIDGLFREAQTKDATFAHRHGLIHDIRDVAIPQGAPLLQLVFSR